MKKPAKKSDKNELFKKLRTIGIVLVVLLVIIKLNKTIFFITIFSIAAYVGKYIRGMFGLKMVVLDPLLFSAIMMAKFIGFKEAVLLVAINTLIIDFLTFIASDGTFANFFLFSASAVTGVYLFGSLNMLIYGSFSALMYSVTYFIYRRIVPSQSPFEVLAKCITSFLFTFMYVSFIGPLLQIFMSI